MFKPSVFGAFKCELKTEVSAKPRLRLYGTRCVEVACSETSGQSARDKNVRNIFEHALAWPRRGERRDSANKPV